MSSDFFFQNPELEARLEKLRAQQANKEYQEMTKNVDLNVSVGNTVILRRFVLSILHV